MELVSHAMFSKSSGSGPATSCGQTRGDSLTYGIIFLEFICTNPGLNIPILNIPSLNIPIKFEQHIL